MQDVDAIYRAWAEAQLPRTDIPCMRAVKDKPWGMRGFAVIDLDGSLLPIGQQFSSSDGGRLSGCNFIDAFASGCADTGAVRNKNTLMCSSCLLARRARRRKARRPAAHSPRPGSWPAAAVQRRAIGARSRRAIGALSGQASLFWARFSACPDLPFPVPICLSVPVPICLDLPADLPALIDEMQLGVGCTLGADKGYDRGSFVSELDERKIKPHLARSTKGRRSAVPAQVARTKGYEKSQVMRKRIESIFGWVKGIGGLRKLTCIGLPAVKRHVAWTFAAYNLARLGKMDGWWDPAPI